MAGALLCATGFAQEQTTQKSNVPADLAKEAKVSLEDARKTALAAVPGGKIQSEELEREKGKLVYSFDIKVGKKSGIEEVGVDAMTGKIIEKKHESAKSEAAEEKADASIGHAPGATEMQGTDPTSYAVTMLPLPGASPAGISLDYLGYDPVTNTVWVPAGNTGSVDVIDASTKQVTRLSGFAAGEMGSGNRKRIVGPSSVTFGERGLGDDPA